MQNAGVTLEMRVSWKVCITPSTSESLLESGQPPGIEPQGLWL